MPVLKWQRNLSTYCRRSDILALSLSFRLLFTKFLASLSVDFGKIFSYEIIYTVYFVFLEARVGRNLRFESNRLCLTPLTMTLHGVVWHSQSLRVGFHELFLCLLCYDQESPPSLVVQTSMGGLGVRMGSFIQRAKRKPAGRRKTR